MLKLIIFLVVSGYLYYISRASLQKRLSHGFFRFFAFEFLLLLILINLKHWFHNPFSLAHSISWLLLFIALFLAIHGFRMLRVIGRPRGKIEDSANFAFENTTRLVMVGAYKYIRHPLYSSLFILTWGVFLKNPSFLGLVLALLTSFFLVATAKVEEGENVSTFGLPYLDYMHRTKMFIPFIF